MYLLKIAFRNLLRQKRRSALLGAAIAFGIAVLVFFSGITGGLTDILMNDIMSLMAGHLEVTVLERAAVRGDMMRDKDYFIDKVTNQHGDKILRVGENITAWIRIVGPSGGDKGMLIGLEETDLDAINVVEGDKSRWFDEDSPILLSKSQAKKLNAKVNDSVNVRFSTATGQMQSRKLKVIGIFEQGSMFFSIGSYTRLDLLKQDFGLADWETKRLRFELKDPEADAKEIANDLYKRVEEFPLAASGEVELKGRVEAATVYTLEPEQSLEDWSVGEDLAEAFKQSEKGVLLSKRLYENIKALDGNAMSFRYSSKFRGPYEIENLKVLGYFEGPYAKEAIVLFPKELADDHLYKYWPGKMDTSAPENWQSHFLPAFEKLERSATFKELQLKLSRLNRTKWHGQVMDINTMYETGSSIISMSRILTLVGFIVALILFAITAIGILNTLNITIRERTRELGTMRAVGMTKLEVFISMIYEVLWLLIVGIAVGLVTGLSLNFLVSLIDFGQEGQLAMFLREGHLNFYIDVLSLTVQILILSALVLLFAIWPIIIASIKPISRALHFQQS